jgi:hypothetical protein
MWIEGVCDKHPLSPRGEVPGACEAMRGLLGVFLRQLPPHPALRATFSRGGEEKRKKTAKPYALPKGQRKLFWKVPLFRMDEGIATNPDRVCRERRGTPRFVAFQDSGLPHQVAASRRMGLWR